MNIVSACLQHLLIVILLIGQLLLTSQRTNAQHTSHWVYPGKDGKLIYSTLPTGDKIMDFSHAGYMGGGVALPGHVPVRRTVHPSGGPDDTQLIQAAIDEVAAMPLDNGFRGAVQLAAGSFTCSGTLYISAGGIVLKGSGTDATTIHMTGSKHAAIMVGADHRQVQPGETEPLPAAQAFEDTGTSITGTYTPAGANTFTVADAAGLAPGDQIGVIRPVTAAWIHFMGMDNLNRNGKPQTWIGKQGRLIMQRRIVAVAGNKITIDIPLADAYDAAYLDPPGMLVRKVRSSSRISQVGIEQLHIQCPPLEIAYGDAPYSGIRIAGDDCWVRDVYCEETMNTTTLAGNRITMEKVVVTHTYPNLGASKPTDFSIEGSQELIDRCSITGDNTYFVWTASLRPGPNVLLNCTFRGHGSRIQPHQRWSTGLLVDNCTVPDGGIDFMNRGVAGSGHGWTMGWAVAWNCIARTYVIQNPPGSANWAIGCIGARQQTARLFDSTPLLAEGHFDSHGVSVAPQSLYLAQLTERLGRQALQNIGYDGDPKKLFTNRSTPPLPPFKKETDPLLGENLALHRPVNASNVRSNARAFGGEKALDADDHTYWTTNDNSPAPTLEIDMENPVDINAVEIVEATGMKQRIQQYKVEGQVDSDWKLLSEGSAIGARKVDRFPKTTVWKVRLTILRSEGAPAISKVGLYLAHPTNDPLFNTPPKNVPTPKTPDGPLAGNGDIGVTPGGAPDSLTFYLGKNDFWRAYPVYPGGGIALPGGLTVLLPQLRSATYHAREILKEAAIENEFDKDSLHVAVHTWVTATRNTVFIECASNLPVKAKLRLWATSGNTSVNSSGNTSGNTSVNSSGNANRIYWVTRSFENTPLLAWPCHIAIAMKVLGQPVSSDSTVDLLPGRPVTIALTLYTNFDRNDWKAAAIHDSRLLTPTLINAMRSEHQQWWRQFWQQSNVEINDPFLQQYYDVSQYLFACSSRKGKFPPGIWGPFITQDSTAWGGDYHLNYNYQAPFWAAFSSNHIDLTDNYDQPLLDYMPEGRRLAKELLNMPGIYYPVGIGPKGLVTTRWPLTPEEMLQRYGTRDNNIDQGYKFLGQKINAVFGATNMLMRFYSTYDHAYGERIYPYLLACADFWEHYLSFEDGRYVIRMDHFNEIMPNLRTNGQWKDRLGDLNSTLSLGLVTMLFRGVIDVSAWLQKDKGRQQQWKYILSHLSKFPVGEKEGRLSLKNMERGPQNAAVQPAGLNRVSIHGLIMPGGVAGPVTDSAFNQLLLNDVAHWKDKMKGPGEWGNTLGNGIETCFPGAVRVGYDPAVILQQLKDRIIRESLPNGWITQTGGGTETLAAVPLTINEMLLQSYEGILRVFPCWDHARDASFSQLRAYGAFLVSSRIKDGRVASVRLISEKGRPCNMENPWPGEKVQLVRNGRPAQVLSGTRLHFITSPGEKIFLTPSSVTKTPHRTSI
jgi:hypothetical protein